jgi:hypothetical protein
MLGEVDAFRFRLGIQLGKSLAEVDAMPYREYVQWKAFAEYERAHRQVGHR